MHTARHYRVASTRVLEIFIATCGSALIVAAVAANQSWLDRHFLPSFFIPRDWYMLIETIVRSAIATAGASLVLGRVRLTRLLASAPAMLLQVVVAAAFAI